MLQISARARLSPWIGLPLAVDSRGAGGVISMPTLSVVGTSVPRIEGRRKVTGEARYTVDATLPGVLTRASCGAPFLTRLSRVSTRRRRLPCRAWRRCDRRLISDGLCTGAVIRDMPVLATDRIRFVGEPIARWSRPMMLIPLKPRWRSFELDLEELPAEFDVDSAMSDLRNRHPSRSLQLRGRPRAARHTQHSRLYTN